MTSQSKGTKRKKKMGGEGQGVSGSRSYSWVPWEKKNSEKEWGKQGGMC